ncbi:hypothetical protein Pr1d_32800 [Bythopirellula goksoeyrii]|uniref:Uncharacterized protein n=1 Tax=Bythopirellula goksoeyrii TaxID=1400387 RepID=A0A5B9QPD1_9BACT|nr:hypothetical protein Pr1d_32800 [Bythopirellula goksoeyrii]
MWCIDESFITLKFSPAQAIHDPTLARCRCDGATAEVSVTSISFCESKVAEVGPTHRSTQVSHALLYQRLVIVLLSTLPRSAWLRMILWLVIFEGLC